MAWMHILGVILTVSFAAGRILAIDLSTHAQSLDPELYKSMIPAFDINYKITLAITLVGPLSVFAPIVWQ